MKINNTAVFNTYQAIYGIRNAFNSWDDSDSSSQPVWINQTSKYWIASYHHCLLGEKDKKLMTSLIKAGSSHRKFLRQIFVCVDMTLPIYVWSELDTYKVGTVRNSCSTMHTLMRRELVQEDFEYPVVQESLWYINGCIERYKKEENSDKKEQLFLEIKNHLPSGFLQKATMTFDYETLLNMYQQRKNHRLPQWHTICEWIRELPYMEIICSI